MGYNNGPFTHFYHGKASPYSVIKEDVQTTADAQYEPEWGHNSGNSYNNGPFTHFYHGKASPYSVIKEDVQTEADQNTNQNGDTTPETHITMHHLLISTMVRLLHT